MKEAYSLTPPGMIDDPYIMVYDARELTDGANAQNLSLQIDNGWDFLLRRVVDAGSVLATAANGGGILLYGPSRSQLASDPQRLGSNYILTPQQLFPRNSYIGFDLFNVLRRVRINCAGTDILTPFVSFQGVRRRAGTGSFAAYQSSYEYYERPFVYRTSITIDYAAYSAAGPPIAYNPPRQFEVNVANYDFELMGINALRATTGAAVNVDEFGVLLYDASGQNRLSNRPVPIGHLNTLQTETYFSVFPDPTLVYPINSSIKFEVESYLCSTELDRTYEIDFLGVMRVPA